MTTVLCVPGTFEPHSVGQPAGMLAGVARLLPRGRYRCVQVNYPMAYGNPMPYADSVEAGIRETLLAAHATDGPIILIGYSQGAVIVARIAAEIRDGRHRDLDVRVGMVVTIANPERAVGEYEHTGVGAPLTGSGVAGGRSLRGCPFPVVQLAIADDVITNASRDSLIRDVADLSDYMSRDVGRWMRTVVDKLVRGDIQNLRWWERLLETTGRTPGRVVTALREASGYPRNHTAYGIRKMPGIDRTYLQYAADKIAAGNR